MLTRKRRGNDTVGKIWAEWGGGGGGGLAYYHEAIIRHKFV